MYLAEDRRGEAGYDTAPEANGELRGTAQAGPRLFQHVAEGELMAELVHCELPDGVGDLSGGGGGGGMRLAQLRPTCKDLDSLAQDRKESGVQSRKAFFTKKACEPSRKPRGVIPLGNEPYTGSFEGCKQDISKEPAATVSPKLLD